MKASTAVLAVIVVGSLMSGAIAWQVRRVEQAFVRRQVAEQTLEVQERVGFDLAVRSDALGRLARRWTLAGGLDRTTWEEEASQHLGDVGGFRTVELAGPDGVVRWAVSRAVGVAPVGAHLATLAQWGTSLETARASGKPDVAAPVEIAPGVPGIVVTIPLSAAQRFDGWLLGDFPVDELVRETHGAVSGYRVTIQHGDALVYDSDGGPTSNVCTSAPLSEIDPSLGLRICATRVLVDAAQGPVPALTLMAGLGFTALAAGLVVALAATRRRGAETAALARDVQRHAHARERASRELADLSYAISHDLRTPLRAIDGYASLLAEDAPPATHAALDRIRLNAQRMARQLDGVIELVRLVRKEPRPRRVDVTECARDRCAALARASPGRDVEVRIAPGIEVEADPEVVDVILGALLDNAWKFSRDRSPAVVEVGPSPDGFWVRDNGVGFDMAYYAKLFRTFETLHGPGMFEGMGLGLAIAARAAASQGGSLRAESRPGEGATFWVVLPRGGEARG